MAPQVKDGGVNITRAPARYSRFLNLLTFQPKSFSAARFFWR